MNVYEIITNKILDQLEQGTVPWQKPWSNTGQLPANFATRSEYRGINAFLLNCLPFGLPLFLTYNQAKSLGGCVKKGEHGFPVTFFKLWETKDRESGDPKKLPLLRYYTVFHYTQCDGLDLSTLPGAKDPKETWERIESAEQLWKGYPSRPSLNIGGDSAFYSPQHDSINLPDPKQFPTAEGYYSTLFHEAGHSTGHESRLKRKGVIDVDYFASHQYSKEELTAEMTAAFLCGITGIENQASLTNSAAYVDLWKRKLKGDAKLIVQAAGQAQKAADMIQGKTFEERKEVAA